MDRTIKQFYEAQDRRKERKRRYKKKTITDKLLPYAKLLATILFLFLILYTIYTYITIERIN